VKQREWLQRFRSQSQTDASLKDIVYCEVWTSDGERYRVQGFDPHRQRALMASPDSVPEPETQPANPGRNSK